MTENEKTSDGRRRGRGRPPGPTARGAEARRRLYEIAIGMIASRGYEAATLRDVASEAGVSVGLIYRYFPSKQAVVLAFYDELSAEYASRSARMPAGRWRERFLHALRTSLGVLGPHRSALAALVPNLVGNAEEGLFARRTAFSRVRVHEVFVHAVLEAEDSPKPELAKALGGLLYLAHLAVILLWLLDTSAGQRATNALIASVERALPAASLVLRFRAVRAFVMGADQAFRDALFEDAPEART